MEILIEVLCEVVLDGIVELITNKKISKWIRYPLAIIFFNFYLIIIALIGVLSINLWSETLIAAGIFMVIDLLLIIGLMFIGKKVISKQKQTIVSRSKTSKFDFSFFFC